MFYRILSCFFRPTQGSNYQEKKIEVLRSGIADLYHDKLLFDIQIEVEGKIFPAHKIILASLSDHFHSSVTDGRKRNMTDQCIVLKGVSSVGVETVLEAMYSDELNTSAPNIRETLKTAHYCKIQPVIENFVQQTTNTIQTEDKSPPSNSCKPKEIAKFLQSRIRDFYQRRVLCDVQLKADGVKFSAHKVILAAVSDYFRAMFCGGFKESSHSNEPIVLEWVSAIGLGVVLGSIYDTKPKVGANNILETIPVACMLQYQPVIDECENFLINSVDMDNYLLYMEVAERFNLKGAVESFVEFRKSRFPCINRTKDFLELEKVDVVKYLSHPDLFTDGDEMKVFEAVVAWIKHKPEERKEHVLDLFKCVNLLQIPLCDIKTRVKTEEIIIDNPECYAIIKEARKYHKKTLTQPLYKGNITNTRGISDGMILFPLIDKYDFGDEFFNRMASFNYWTAFGEVGPELAYWKYLSLAKKDKFCGSPDCQCENKCCYNSRRDYVTRALPGRFREVVKMGNFLFVLATEFEYDSDCDSDSDSDPELDWPPDGPLMLSRYNPLLDEWLSLTPPPIDDYTRLTFVQCSDKHIMLYGVKDYNPTTYTGVPFSWIYKITTDKWKKGLPVPESRYSDTIDEYYNGTLYHTSDASLLKFDVDNKCWEEESYLGEPLRDYTLGLGLTFMIGQGNSLFIGYEIGRPIPLVEVIAEYSLETKQWTYYPLGPAYYEFKSGLSHNGNLYLFSNDYSNEHDKKTEIFRFDPKDRTCSLVRALPCYAGYPTAVPMHLPR